MSAIYVEETVSHHRFCAICKRGMVAARRPDWPAGVYVLIPCPHCARRIELDVAILGRSS